MPIVGFSWLLFGRLQTLFSDYLSQFNTTPWDYFIGLKDDWLENVSAINYLKNIALGLSALIGALPPVFVYMFSLGFCLVLIGCVISIVLRLL